MEYFEGKNDWAWNKIDYSTDHPNMSCMETRLHAIGYIIKRLLDTICYHKLACLVLFKIE